MLSPAASNQARIQCARRNIGEGAKRRFYRRLR